MRILFLDIDGVLCTLRAQFAFGERLLMEEWDITVCQMIRRLCEKHDLKIVISSVWRRDKENCWRYLMIYALQHYLHKDWYTPVLKGIRGKEVAAWLKSHLEIKDYLIIDDDKDFYKNQMRRFIHVKNNYDGFGAYEYMAVDNWFSRKRRKDSGK